MRTFSLKDDCTLSGRRLHRDERRVEGGGYVCPEQCRGVNLTAPLVPAHGFVETSPEGMKKGEKEMPPDRFRSL